MDCCLLFRARSKNNSNVFHRKQCFRVWLEEEITTGLLYDPIVTDFCPLTHRWGDVEADVQHLLCSATGGAHVQTFAFLATELSSSFGVDPAAVFLFFGGGRPALTLILNYVSIWFYNQHKLNGSILYLFFVCFETDPSVFTDPSVTWKTQSLVTTLKALCCGLFGILLVYIFICTVVCAVLMMYMVTAQVEITEHLHHSSLMFTPSDFYQAVFSYCPVN